MIRTILPLLALLCSFANITRAQNYYPTDIGNIWVLEDADGTERTTYALEAPEVPVAGEARLTLKMTSEVLGTTSVSTSTFLLQVEASGIKLHQIVADLGGVFGVGEMAFSPPAIFFPETLQLGDLWETYGETEVNVAGPVEITSTNEVVAIEDVDTPAGTFLNAIKIRVRTRIATVLGVTRSTSYQWLAPNFGPVKFQTAQDIVFELVDSNLLPTKTAYDVNADGVVNILDLVSVAAAFGGTDPAADVNADGRVDILDLTLIAQNFSN